MTTNTTRTTTRTADPYMNPAVKATSAARRRVAKAAAEYAYSHPGYTFGDIFTAYDRPSAAKVRAWEYCKGLCHKMGGFDLRISSRNTFRFAAVFQYCDPETGVLCYAYITPDYDSFCEA